MARKAKLGTGARFAKLEHKFENKKGVTSPGGLAAYIGRKKYGAAKFAKLSAGGRKGTVHRREVTLNSAKSVPYKKKS